MRGIHPVAKPSLGRHIPQQRPITLDPPAHGKYRGPLQATFSPKSAVGKREEIRALADSLIDAVKDQGHCDFITSTAEPLPVQVFLKMVGLPLDRQAHFRHLVLASSCRYSTRRCSRSCRRSGSMRMSQ